MLNATYFKWRQQHPCFQIHLIKLIACRWHRPTKLFIQINRSNHRSNVIHVTAHFGLEIRVSHNLTMNDCANLSWWGLQLLRLSTSHQMCNITHSFLIKIHMFCRHFQTHVFNAKYSVSIQSVLKFVSSGTIEIESALFQAINRYRTSLYLTQWWQRSLTHICVTRPKVTRSIHVYVIFPLPNVILFFKLTNLSFGYHT